MTRAPWTDADIETIRTSVATMNDTKIAALLGWPTWRVIHVRRRHNIPAHHQECWPKVARDLIEARYIRAGMPAPVVAEELKALGLRVSASALRRKATRMGLERDPATRQRNHNIANARIGEAKRARAMPGPMLSLHNAPKRWSAVEDHRSLNEKILSALKERPLSVMALASVIGAKEYAVDVQLAALAHAGGVEAGPAVECGRRNRLWRAAA